LQPRAAWQGGDPETGWNGSTSFGMWNACECQRRAWIRPGTAGRAQPVLPCRPGRRRKFGAEAGYTIVSCLRQVFFQKNCAVLTFFINWKKTRSISPPLRWKRN